MEIIVITNEKPTINESDPLLKNQTTQTKESDRCLVPILVMMAVVTVAVIAFVVFQIVFSVK